MEKETREKTDVKPSKAHWIHFLFWLEMVLGDLRKGNDYSPITSLASNRCSRKAQGTAQGLAEGAPLGNVHHSAL